MTRSTKDTAEERSLVAALRRRDRAAVGLLYDRYAPALLGTISRILGEPEVAEDVLQETFVKVWRSFDSYDDTKGALATWLTSVARSVAIDKVRSKGFRNARKNQSIETAVPQVESRTSTSLDADTIGVDGLLRTLRPEQQEIIELIYYQGFTQEEAARELAIPLGTLKTRARAAIRELRSFFRTERSE